MLRMLKVEIKRAFINRLFLVSLIIGCIISILQVVERALPYASGIDLYPNQYPPSLYNSCIGLSFSMWSSIFYFVFPLLAAIPYADSFLTDKKSGYLENIYTRGKKINYLISKFVAVFLSGGCVVLLPLLLNILLTALCVPAVIPDASTGFFPIFGYATWANIYYSTPIVYVLLFQILTFITAGVLSCSALLFSFVVKYKYIVLITPFLLFIAITYGSMLFSQGNSFNISEWINPMQSIQALNLWAVGIELLIILSISIGIYLYVGCKRDTI